MVNKLRFVVIASLPVSAIALATWGAPREQDLETRFLAENHAAMDKMMADMSKTPSGDVDVDFTAMMIPHHQGAIDMAQAELRYGRNEQLRRIAQQILVEQQQEMVAMRRALEPLESAPPWDSAVKSEP
jgi:uncharacterized protein (DUF305 family)